MDGHLAIPCILKLNQQTINSLALIDSSASGFEFIDHFYVHKHNIPIILLNTPQTLEEFDRNPTEYGQITHVARIDYLSFDMHKECNFYLYVSYLHHPSFVLRHLWLQKHDLHIYWKENTITFDSFFCQSHSSSKLSLVTISRLGELDLLQIPLASTLIFLELSLNVINTNASKLRLNITRIGAAPFTMLTRKPGHKVFIVNLRDLD